MHPQILICSFVTHTIRFMLSHFSMHAAMLYSLSTSHSLSFICLFLIDSYIRVVWQSLLQCVMPRTTTAGKPIVMAALAIALLPHFASLQYKKKDGRVDDQEHEDQQNLPLQAQKDDDPRHSESTVNHQEYQHEETLGQLICQNEAPADQHEVTGEQPAKQPTEQERKCLKDETKSDDIQAKSRSLDESSMQPPCLHRPLRVSTSFPVDKTLPKTLPNLTDVLDSKVFSSIFTSRSI